MTFILIALSFTYKTPVGEKIQITWWSNLLIVFVLTFFVWALGRFLVSRFIINEEEGAEAVERVFQRIQIGTSCYVALSQGANDVANAVAPIVAIYIIAKQHTLLAQAEVPLYILALGGLGIALGIMCFGRKVIYTVGKRITTLTNTRGFAVDFGTATTVLTASNLGLPVSTTHAAVGGVIGVGLARGFSAVDFSVLIRIVLYWILTVPIAAFTSIIFYHILRWIFL